MWAYTSRKLPDLRPLLLAIVVGLTVVAIVAWALKPAYLIVLLALFAATVSAHRIWRSRHTRPDGTVSASPRGFVEHARRRPAFDAQARAWVSLELLQTVLAEFVDNPNSLQPFLRLLRQIETMTNATCSAIFVTGNNEQFWSPLVCTDDAQSERLIHLLRDGLTMADLRARSAVTLHDPARSDMQLVALRLPQTEAGGESILLLQISSSAALSPAELASLDALGRSLAGIIRSARRAQQNQRLALCDERAVIARELHDSLAQSLSYLKIQVSRLQSLLRLDAPGQTLDDKDTDAVVQELRTHLNLAYGQLRELITTFRLTMDGRSLAQALADSVEEFENRSGIVFSLDNRVAVDLLSVDEELQVLQIVRECLCNIVRHAHARYATVSLDSNGAGRVAVTVDDDGIGLGEPGMREQHHGLVIMQQRAHGLGGEMHVSANPQGGMRVRVVFMARGPDARPGAPSPTRAYSPDSQTRS